MDLGLQGKTALVAGASRGLGYSVARLLAVEGVNVSMASSQATAIEEAGETIRQETGAAVLARPADLRDAGSIRDWVAATRERFGGIDLLFVNSGGPPAGGFEQFDDQAWCHAFELLVLSAVRMVREALPLMRARGGGSILFSSSSSVKEPIANLTLSNVVRAPVPALAKTLAVELAKDGIRVNHLMPGRIDTSRVRQLDQINAAKNNLSMPEWQQRMAAAIPLGRYGHAEEYARAAVFLLSNAASYITGATLQVDGGMLRSVL